MNKIILISENQIDTDLFNNQIFLEDTQRSETIASPVSTIEIEQTKKEQQNFSFFIIIAFLIVFIIVLIAFIIRISKNQSQNKQVNENNKVSSYVNDTEEIGVLEKRSKKRIKGQTYATPNSLNEAIRQFLNITKIK